MNRLRLRAEGGFTLIELLVVIAIIGILAAIAIPQFAAYRRRGYEADALSAARNAATAQEAYFVNNQGYASQATTLQTFGFAQGTKITLTTTANTGSFTITSQNTNCAGTSGQYTFDSSASTMTLVANCR
jgi:type IV pilus assembly protein PilA